MTRRASVELGVALLLMVTVVAVAAIWGGPRPAPEPRADAFEVTRGAVAAAPEFELADLAGRPVRLRDFRGRVVLLNFWATWCVPCREEMPAIETLARELGAGGLTVLAVNYRETPELVAGFVREYGLTFRVLLDADGEVASRYRVVGLPATYFVDRSGTLVGSVLGIRDWNGSSARAYLTKLLASRG